MEYVAFIGTEGPTPEGPLQVMRRELPGWVQRMNGRGVRLLGRELDFPDKAVTVRVRAGETLVSDGPFAETKEFVAGFDLLRCGDLDEAIEVMSTSPVAWYHPIELRPFRGEPRLGPDLTAFGRMDDTVGAPYQLTAWVGSAPPAAVDRECAAWRDDVAARGLHVLGGALAGPEAATTLRVQGQGGETGLEDGQFLELEAFIAALDVVRCTDREQAVELAARHPLARDHAIEVRPFYMP